MPFVMAMRVFLPISHYLEPLSIQWNEEAESVTSVRFPLKTNL